MIGIDDMLGNIATEAAEQTLVYNLEKRKRRIGFMDYRNPEIIFCGANEEEKEIAAQFTRIAPINDPPEHSAWLKVGDQYFKVNDAEDPEHASWHCWMLAKALITIRKAVKVTLNGQTIFAHTNVTASISYEELVEVAGMKGQPSMTYRGKGLQGILSPGHSIELAEGMIIEAVHTGQA